jgi:hypothetical protein
MAKFFGINLEPLFIDGLHGIASWRDIAVEKLLIEVAQKYPLDIPGGCRTMVREFFAERHNIGSRQVQRANQRRVLDIGSAGTIRRAEVESQIRRPRDRPPPRRLLYP